MFQTLIYLVAKIKSKILFLTGVPESSPPSKAEANPKRIISRPYIMNYLSFILFVTAAALSSAVPFAPSRHASILRAVRGGSAEPPIADAAGAADAADEVDVVDEAADGAADGAVNNLSVVDSKLGPNAPPPGFLRQKFPNVPYHRIPNMISAVRCVTIPLLMLMFYQPNQHVATAVLFAFASLTDWVDGYLARLWDITSPLGALIDTVADKLMVSTALILLAGRHGVEVAVPTAIIVSREIAVTALREWMAQQGKRDAIKFKFQGKLKTAATMVSLTILLLAPANPYLSQLYQPGLALLYLCAVLTITSGSAYFFSAALHMSGKESTPSEPEVSDISP